MLSYFPFFNLWLSLRMPNHGYDDRVPTYSCQWNQRGRLPWSSTGIHPVDVEFPQLHTLQQKNKYDNHPCHHLLSHSRQDVSAQPNTSESNIPHNCPSFQSVHSYLHTGVLHNCDHDHQEGSQLRWSATYFFSIVWCVWRWCVVSYAVNRHNSATNWSYWELCIWACCCWQGQTIDDGFRISGVI